MKYSLSQNAISSLCISIDHFKILYYHQEDYSQSQLDEAAKICVVFLENAIELLLKTILVSDEPLAIYKEPNSKAIRKALAKTTDTTKLEDILISERCFQTISYTETVERYNEKYHNSKKVYEVLKELGETRNAITHFGIDTAEKKSILMHCLSMCLTSSIIICILNWFILMILVNTSQAMTRL